MLRNFQQKKKRKENFQLIILGNSPEFSTSKYNIFDKIMFKFHIRKNFREHPRVITISLNPTAPANQFVDFFHHRRLLFFRDTLYSIAYILGNRSVCTRMLKLGDGINLTRVRSPPRISCLVSKSIKITNPSRLLHRRNINLSVFFFLFDVQKLRYLYVEMPGYILPRCSRVVNLFSNLRRRYGISITHDTATGRITLYMRLRFGHVVFI